MVPSGDLAPQKISSSVCTQAPGYMQNNLGSSEGQVLLLAIIGKLTIFNHYPFVYSTPLKSLHLASNGR